MKKILSLLVIMLGVLVGYSQAPGILNYQGVARNSVGNVLVNKTINLRLTIRDGAAAGPTVYQESRIVTTNPFGLFNVQVGSPGATSVTGTIPGVNWAVGAKFIQVEIDPNGGTSFINIGTAQLASVPYSLYSNLSGDLVLPFNKTQADAGTLFKITNSNTTSAGATALEGLTNSTAGNANAIIGTVTSASPGGFSAGVRGINNGTGGLGIGVHGSQAGSGWGVYGFTPGGIGVNGASNTGIGVNGSSVSGDGVRGTSTSAFGVYGVTSAGNASGVLGDGTGTGSSMGVLGRTGEGSYPGLLGNAGVAGRANANIGVAGSALSGTGGYFTSASGLALNTAGNLRHTGINEALNRILRSDAAGNATWVDPSFVGIVTGSGTLNFVPKWTPSGTTLGNSLMQDDNNSISVGNYFADPNSFNIYTTPGSSANASLFLGLNSAGGLYMEEATGDLHVTLNGVNVQAGQKVMTFEDGSLNVGIGTTAPSAKLHTLSAATTGGPDAVLGQSNNTDASAVGIRGVITSTAPGGFSAGVRGVNNGTGGLGIGVYGSQAGSGWGVYGTTPGGIGVHGSSANGFGMYGLSTNGTGVYGTSTTGESGRFENTNNANASHVLNAITNGTGRALNVIAGSSSQNATRSLLGTAPATSIATAGSIYGESSSGIGVIGVSGTQNGVYGLSTGSLGGTTGVNTGSGNALWGVSTGTGRAGYFQVSNAANSNNAVEIDVTGLGQGIDVGLTNAASAGRGINVSVAGSGSAIYAETQAGFAGVEGRTNTISGAGIIGRNMALGEAIVGFTSGGVGVGAVVGRNDGAGYGVRGFITNTGIGVLGQAGISGSTGAAGRFENVSAANGNTALEVSTNSNSTGGGISVDLSNASNSARGINVTHAGSGSGIVAETQSGSAGVEGRTNTISGAGIIGRNLSNGEAIVGFTTANGVGAGAVVGRNDGDYAGVHGFSTHANGIGIVARVINATATNSVALLANNAQGGASGNIAIFQNNGTNVARVDRTGRGYFNNGTQVGGADVAEFFEAEGDRNEYEAGDVLVISQHSDRKVEKSSTAYSTLVSGVYATKPGLLLTERNAEANETADMVPMGVIGVIPTKVCLEGGEIKRGDLLVTSSIPGVAMKADPEKVKVGQVLGKALQDFNSTTVGKINVLVSVK